MPMNTPQNSGPGGAGQAGDRLTNLELLFVHLERQVVELSQMVRQQGEQMERLRRELRRIEQAAEHQNDDRPESEESSWDQ